MCVEIVSEMFALILHCQLEKLFKRNFAWKAKRHSKYKKKNLIPSGFCRKNGPDTRLVCKDEVRLVWDSWLGIFGLSADGEGDTSRSVQSSS